MRKKTREFFTELLGNQNVPIEFYIQNEEAFFKLIHNTYDDSKRTIIGECMKHMPITDLFNEVFGQHPNRKNLVQFFSSEVVRQLWNGFFIKSREFKQWKVTFHQFSNKE
jgi:hypothetical protein